MGSLRYLFICNRYLICSLHAICVQGKLTGFQIDKDFLLLGHQELLFVLMSIKTHRMRKDAKKKLQV